VLFLLPVPLPLAALNVYVKEIYVAEVEEI
jgi:hypothetical protein